MLNDRKAELETHQQEVEQFLNTIFKDIFIMRYRDICSDIRVICMDEISVWMRTFPKGFKLLIFFCRTIILKNV